jgi:hypothetical protein
LDTEVTEDAKARLMKIAKKLKTDPKPWPSANEYFGILEKSVADEYQNDHATLFRIRHLANRLTDLYIFGR